MATPDLESAVVTPLLIPGVGNEPVVLSVLGAPAKELHSVTTKLVVAGLAIHTGLAGWEVIVHCEGGGGTAVLHDVGLDGGDAAQAVGVCGLDLVIFVALGVTRLRALAERWRWVLAAWAGWVLGSGEISCAFWTRLRSCCLQLECLSHQWMTLLCTHRFRPSAVNAAGHR